MSWKRDKTHVNKQFPDDPEMLPLSRTQILIAMGVTAILLLLVARLWLWFGSVKILETVWSPESLAWGLSLGLLITVASSGVYRIWPAYRQSADFYLHIVLRPLLLPDLIWLGLLPGLSEELLFRGVMLPALGLDAFALVVSSACFGVLHLSGRHQWPYVIWATAIGGLLGFSALVTGNLLVPVVAHIVTNLLSSFIWKRQQSSASI